MLKPDKSDPMKVRRTLAFFVSIYAFLVLPNLLVAYQILAGADIGLLQSILTYVGILAGGPIGAYLYAAHKNGNSEAKMIAFLLKHRNIIAGLAAFAVLAGVLYWKDFQIERLEQKLAAAEVTAASYRQSLATLQEETARRIKAVEHESQQEIKRTKDLERILGSIEGADDDENGTVSPVLRGTIDRLYGRDANNGGSR